MNPIHKKWGVLSAARWLWGSRFHLSEQDISLMVLADLKWSTFCSYGTLHQIFKTLEIITQSCYWSWEYERWGTMCFRMTCFPGVGPVNVCHGPCWVSSVTAEVHFLLGPYSLFLSSLHSLLHSSPSPIRGAPAVYQSGSEARSISQIHLCSDWITPQSSLFIPRPPHPKYTSIHPCFHECPLEPPPHPHPSLADSSANPKSEDMKNEIQIQYVHLNQLCGWPCRNTLKIQFRLLWGLFVF